MYNLVFKTNNPLDHYRLKLLMTDHSYSFVLLCISHVNLLANFLFIVNLKCVYFCLFLNFLLLWSNWHSINFQRETCVSWRQKNTNIIKSLLLIIWSRSRSMLTFSSKFTCTKVNDKIYAMWTELFKRKYFNFSCLFAFQFKFYVWIWGAFCWWHVFMNLGVRIMLSLSLIDLGLCII